jgi:hypothetical protein
MTSFDRFERNLPELFDELASPRVPDYFDDLLTRTAATRQRPVWAIPERWFSMSAITRRFAVAPRIPWRLGVAVALLAVAALIAALVAGSFGPKRPAAYGPAGNGHIAFVDAQGRVVAGNPATGSTVILATEDEASDPMFSPDGSRVFYIRHVSAATVDLVVVSLDGSTSVTLNAEPMFGPGFGAWSANGNHFLVLSAGKDLLAYDTRVAGTAQNLSAAVGLDYLDIGLGYNFRSTQAYRPPSGDEIIAITRDQRLVAIREDGTAYRTVLDRETSPVPFTRMRGAEWSPDGTRIALMLEQASQRERWHAYVMNADGTGLRPLGTLGADPNSDQNSLLWSPDGTRIAYQYWTRHTADDGQDFHPIGIVDVATGATHDVGPVLTNGATWDWSPDGASIVEVPGDGSGAILIVNAATGVWDPAPWTFTRPSDPVAAGDWCHDCLSWQRLAP